MPKEVSAGGVVLRKMQGRWWLAAIEPQRDAPGQRRILALPKGLVDGGEKPEQTAIREVREETGLEVEPAGKLGDIKYVYTRQWGDGERVFKIVSFYLFRYRAGRLGEIAPEMRKEVRSAEWIPLEDAPRLLSYKGEREMVAKAAEMVKENA